MQPPKIRLILVRHGVIGGPMPREPARSNHSSRRLGGRWAPQNGQKDSSRNEVPPSGIGIPTRETWQRRELSLPPPRLPVARNSSSSFLSWNDLSACDSGFRHCASGGVHRTKMSTAPIIYFNIAVSVIPFVELLPIGLGLASCGL